MYRAKSSDFSARTVTTYMDSVRPIRFLNLQQRFNLIRKNIYSLFPFSFRIGNELRGKNPKNYSHRPCIIYDLTAYYYETFGAVQLPGKFFTWKKRRSKIVVKSIHSSLSWESNKVNIASVEMRMEYYTVLKGYLL